MTITFVADVCGLRVSKKYVRETRTYNGQEEVRIIMWEEYACGRWTSVCVLGEEGSDGKSIHVCGKGPCVWLSRKRVRLWENCVGERNSLCLCENCKCMCVRACVRACVRVCVCVWRGRGAEIQAVPLMGQVREGEARLREKYRCVTEPSTSVWKICLYEKGRSTLGGGGGGGVRLWERYGEEKWGGGGVGMGGGGGLKSFCRSTWRKITSVRTISNFFGRTP